MGTSDYWAATMPSSLRDALGKQTPYHPICAAPGTAYSVAKLKIALEGPLCTFSFVTSFGVYGYTFFSKMFSLSYVGQFQQVEHNKGQCTI